MSGSRGKAAREAIEIPPSVGAFIRRRVDVLAQPDRAPIDLACDAYIQGVTDAATVLRQRAESRA
ncbi:MAG: hypothetical protein K2X61_08180 [Caulobacteraceae bacterium]|nr:hypothetical protein [Caulobacteraceae bacterium]